MTEVMAITLLGIVLAWALLPPPIHPAVRRRLNDAIPRRVRKQRPPTRPLAGPRPTKGWTGTAAGR